MIQHQQLILAKDENIEDVKKEYSADGNSILSLEHALQILLQLQQHASLKVSAAWKNITTEGVLKIVKKASTLNFLRVDEINVTISHTKLLKQFENRNKFSGLEKQS